MEINETYYKNEGLLACRSRILVLHALCCVRACETRLEYTFLDQIKFLKSVFKIFSPYNTRPEVLVDRILSLAVFCFLWLLLTPGRARQRQIHGHQVISM